MRCKKHPSDPSSSGGVCASCLRERLHALQSRAPVEPPPIAFPGSERPGLDRRFYSTPQADPGKKQRFSLLSGLFRSRSGSWFSSLLSDQRGRRRRQQSVSGLGFCLSPLVRASPARQWKHTAAPDTAEVNPHLSTAAAFCANRSRKLADFGRLNHNR